MRRSILATPQAARRQINKLRAAVGIGQLEPQLEIGVHQHRQLADQHQPAIRHIAQITNGLVREPIEHFQETRQLVPQDKPFDNHVRIHYREAIEHGRAGVSKRPAPQPGQQPRENLPATFS